MPTCFVVQGFHKKTDFESGRVLDLDASYEVIKEAVEKAGYSCERADEIRHSRTIDQVMYERLLGADLVIADLSTSNVNVFYELGVRFALRPYSTIVVAEEQINFPFDVNHIPIHTYKHLGDDIGRREANRFTNELIKLIQSISHPVPQQDSPVFTFLPALSALTVEELKTVTEIRPDEDAPDVSLSDLKRNAQGAMSDSDFLRAIELWTELRTKGPKDDFVVQQLALATYKSEQPSKLEALEQARELMSRLWPHESLDPETLGLWAAINKRMYELEGDAPTLDEAILATEKGWVLRRDYYNGINLAFLLDTRAAASGADAAREDHAHAQGVRRRVIEVCEAIISSDDAVSGDDRYWVLATLEEAAAGLGDTAAEAEWHAAAAEAATADWMVDSTAEQLEKLQQLLPGAREAAGF